MSHNTESAMTLATPIRRRFTIDEYLRIERDSAERHEHDDGEILAMAGGSPEHALIVLNIGGEIRNRHKGGRFRAYSSDLRVRLTGAPRYVYPDVAVICGDVLLDPDDPARQTATNPRLVVEVLSPSTESYDRRTKFDRYRQLESFREYVLVSHDTPRVETFYRRDDGTWVFAVATGLDGTIGLPSLGIELPLSEVYAAVTFPTPPTPDVVAPQS